MRAKEKMISDIRNMKNLSYENILKLNDEWTEFLYSLPIEERFEYGSVTESLKIACSCIKMTQKNM